MEHLVKVVVYITDVRHREAVYRTMGEYIKGVHPVSTGLVVQAFRTGAARLAGRDRRHRRHPGLRPRGRDCAAGGNLLANDRVPAAMVAAFEAASGHLGDRLIAALKAGRDAGGEAGPVHSAGLKMVDKLSWPVADLRCDWIDEGCPIDAVARAWEVYRPQMAAYVQRASDPTQAPSYGVPGDE
jgi:uncharacterized Ntn-hydrolase superfamily protein